MNTEKLKPFNEFNSEKSAMVNEICYRLSTESTESSLFKELKKIQIPLNITPGGQVTATIGTSAEYGNAGILPILVETGSNALAFGKITNSSGASLVIKNTGATAVSTSGVLYLLIMEVK